MVKETLQRQQRSTYTALERSNATVCSLRFTVSGKRHVRNRQECHNSALWSQFSQNWRTCPVKNFWDQLKKRLQTMDIFFADSLKLIKTLVRKKFPSCKILIKLFQRRNQSSLYSFLFQKFLQCRRFFRWCFSTTKTLFESRIYLSQKTVVENSGVVTASHTAEFVICLDRHHILVQTVKENLHHLQYLKKNVNEKVSGNGLAFEDLQLVYRKRFGKEGLIAILLQATILNFPSSCPTTGEILLWLYQ